MRSPIFMAPVAQVAERLAEDQQTVARNHPGAPVACSSTAEHPPVTRIDVGSSPTVPAKLALDGKTILNVRCEITFGAVVEKR